MTIVFNGTAKAFVSPFPRNDNTDEGDDVIAQHCYAPQRDSATTGVSRRWQFGENKWNIKTSE